MKNRFNPSYTLCKHCNKKFIFDSSKFCCIECHFWHYVKKSEGCWEWQGVLGESGYGRFNIGKRFIAAHRMSYLIHHGFISDFLNVLHKCDNPKCVNPDHLYEGNQSQNNDDMVSRNRHPAQCRKGYEGKYSDELLDRILSLKRQGHSYKKISEMIEMPFGSIYYIYKIAHAKSLGLGRKEANEKSISSLSTESYMTQD